MRAAVDVIAGVLDGPGECRNDPAAIVAALQAEGWHLVAGEVVGRAVVEVDADTSRLEATLTEAIERLGRVDINATAGAETRIREIVREELTQQLAQQALRERFQSSGR